MPADSFDYPERFARTVDFLGEEGLARLRRATVVVVGLGGVGSHAACVLARAGVGTLRVVDFDRVTPSSLNRSAFAAPQDVGRLKIEALAAYLARVVPEARVEPLEAFAHDDTAAAVLAPPLDHVIDAIDSETPKAALIAACVRAGVPVVTCMGAAARRDPSLVRVADLFETSMCALARNVRRRVRKAGVTARSGVTAVYSIEIPIGSLPPDANDPAPRRGRERRRLPSLGMVPAVAGHTAAAIVLERLAAGAG